MTKQEWFIMVIVVAMLVAAGALASNGPTGQLANKVHAAREIIDGDWERDIADAKTTEDRATLVFLESRINNCPPKNVMPVENAEDLTVVQIKNFMKQSEKTCALRLYGEISATQPGATALSVMKTRGLVD